MRVRSAYFHPAPLLSLVYALLSGCAHSGPTLPDAVNDPARYLSHQIEKTKKEKAVVICIQSDMATNQRLESYMVDYLNKNGFHAVGTKELIPVQESYTPLGILREFRSAGISGVIEVTFSGRMTPEGVPENYVIKYLDLKIKKKDVVNQAHSTITGALVQLLIAMPITKF